VIVLALWAGLVTGYGEVTEFGVRLLRGFTPTQP
jgi:hypothetical protein